MNVTGAIPTAKRIALALGISWLASVSLGLVYGARVVGTVSVPQLWVMGVIQVATIISTVIGIFLTPLIAWVLRSYGVIKWIVLLWLLSVIWVLTIFTLTHSGGIALEGALLLTLVGLIVIRLRSEISN
ncbi:MAG: hypothetical protein ABSG14_04125 [Verrucomicrobiia bacterium]|jgi:hypothetical protein